MRNIEIHLLTCNSCICIPVHEGLNRQNCKYKCFCNSYHLSHSASLYTVWKDNSIKTDHLSPTAWFLKVVSEMWCYCCWNNKHNGDVWPLHLVQNSSAALWLVGRLCFGEQVGLQKFVWMILWAFMNRRWPIVAGVYHCPLMGHAVNSLWRIISCKCGCPKHIFLPSSLSHLLLTVCRYGVPLRYFSNA